MSHMKSVHAYGLLALEAPLDVLVPRLLAQLAQAPRHRLLDRGEARVALEGADGALVEGVAAADEGAVRGISRLWELFCIIISLFIFAVSFVYCLFLFTYTLGQTVQAYSSMSRSQRPLKRQVETSSADTLPVGVCTTVLPGMRHAYRTSVPMSVPLEGRQSCSCKLNCS